MQNDRIKQLKAQQSFNVNDLADILDSCYRTALRKINSGVINAVKPPSTKEYRISRAELERYLGDSLDNYLDDFFPLETLVK